MEVGGDDGDPPQQQQNKGFFSEGVDALNPEQGGKRFVPITQNENHKAKLLQTHAFRCATPLSWTKQADRDEEDDMTYYHNPGGDLKRLRSSGMPLYTMPTHGQWWSGKRKAKVGTLPSTLGVRGPRPDTPEPDYWDDDAYDDTVPDPSKM